MKAAAFALLAGAALASPCAVAADFTFDVPVVIENVPSATTAAISCVVSIAPPDGTSAFAGSNVVGRGETSVAITGGAYRGTVTVEVNATGVNLPSAARSYICSMGLLGQSLTGVRYRASSGNARDAYSRATGLTVDRLVMIASGRLP